MGLIKTMAQEFGVPCLCNIHDVALAMEFCNRIIGLQDGVKMFDGPVEQMDQAKLDEIYADEVTTDSSGAGDRCQIEPRRRGSMEAAVRKKVSMSGRLRRCARHTR